MQAVDVRGPLVSGRTLSCHVKISAISNLKKLTIAHKTQTVDFCYVYLTPSTPSSSLCGLTLYTLTPLFTAVMITVATRGAT